MQDILNIHSRRELFCDGYLLNGERTTAETILHTPVRRETVFVCDNPWEGNTSNYYSFFYDAEFGIYRMYYKSGQAFVDSPTIKVHPSSQFCYAESTDGLHWTKPDLGLWGHTNILTRDLNIDNFFVFKDENPACPPSQRYKAVCGYKTLWYYPSADGIHFRFEEGADLMEMGAGYFDTLNTVRWDKTLGKYVGFFRMSRLADGTIPKNMDDESRFIRCLRDIMYCTSEDFFHWDEPVALEYADDYIFELYTNCVSRYPRAPHIYTAFPTRYVQRQTWDCNYDALGGKEGRRMRYEKSDAGRGGLAVTETLFMTSRDGIHWTRFPEAFLRPGPQTEENWMYGDRYPAVGFLETPNHIPGADPELSMLIPDGRLSEKPSQLVRYSLRMDGFVSLHAGYEEKVVVTKPFLYTGKTLHMNFSTSAAGFVQVKLKDFQSNALLSPELFGDSTDRTVPFYDGDPGMLEGRPVVLEVRMSDADLYSIQFRDE